MIMAKMQPSFDINKFAILVQDQINALATFDHTIINVDKQLKTAKQALMNVPGVQNAVGAIDQNIKDNYQRKYQADQAHQAEVQMVQAFQQGYLQFRDTVAQLDVPESAPDQLSLKAPQPQQK